MTDLPIENGVFILSTAVDVLVIGGLVAWAVRGRHRPARVALAIALVGALLLAKLVVLIRGGVGTNFGLMHLLWLDLVVVVPLAAALLGLLAWRGSGWLLRLLVVLGLLLAPFGAYASFVEPSRLVVERADVPLDPQRAGEDPVRIAVLSDIQFEHLGDHEREAVDRLMAERPDVILLPGDYHQGSPETFEQELPGLRRLFARLRAPGGVYAVQGDQETLADAHRIFDASRIRLLVDERVTTRVGDRRITIGGNRNRDYGPSAQALARRLAAGTGAPGGDDGAQADGGDGDGARAGGGADGERAEGDADGARAESGADGDADVRILLSHHPDPVMRLEPGSRIDLVVAGHTHGGQVQLPVIGPLSVASRIGREIGAGGLHELDGNRIYVSRGVGVERGQAPRLRFGAPPEISLLTVG